MIQIALSYISSNVPRRCAETSAVEAAINALEKNAVLSHRKNGAPYIIGHEEKTVSVSHCRTIAAVALADTPIGIDIENNRSEQLKKIADRFLSDDEKKTADKIESGLLMAWTAKEAVFKADQGLNAQYLADIKLDTTDFSQASIGETKYEIAFFAIENETLMAVTTPLGLYNKPHILTLYEREQTPLTIYRTSTTDKKPSVKTVKKTPRKLVFATNNAHKLSEMRQIVEKRFDILSLADIGCTDDIPEDADTLEGNALAKARWIAERYGYDCFADDTGLEVDALGGEPGVHSARYAPGTSHDAAANTALLLKKLTDTPTADRTARFRTVIALIIDGRVHNFEGRVEGLITNSPVGCGGFGYDPVFRPVGFDRTFAQLSAEEKNAVSHRGRATRALLDYLQNID